MRLFSGLTTSTSDGFFSGTPRNFDIFSCSAEFVFCPILIQILISK